MLRLYKILKTVYDLSDRSELANIVDLDSINKPGSMGYTALHYAVKEKREDIVAFLLENHADPNIRSRDYGWTPLHIAGRNRNYKLAELLIRYGADKNIYDNDGNKPDLYFNQITSTCSICGKSETGCFYSYWIMSENHKVEGPKTTSTYKLHESGSAFICMNCSKKRYGDYRLFMELAYLIMSGLLVGLTFFKIPAKEESDYLIMIGVATLWFFLSRLVFMKIMKNKASYLEVLAGKSDKLKLYRNHRHAKVVSQRYEWLIFQRNRKT